MAPSQTQEVVKAFICHITWPLILFCIDDFPPYTMVTSFSHLSEYTVFYKPNIFRGNKTPESYFENISTWKNWVPVLSSCLQRDWVAKRWAVFIVPLFSHPNLSVDYLCLSQKVHELCGKLFSPSLHFVLALLKVWWPIKLGTAVLCLLYN